MSKSVRSRNGVLRFGLGRKVSSSRFVTMYCYTCQVVAPPPGAKISGRRALSKENQSSCVGPESEGLLVMRGQLIGVESWLEML